MGNRQKYDADRERAGEVGVLLRDRFGGVGCLGSELLQAVADHESVSVKTIESYVS